ncbi:MAG TPA: Gmad2 immunoglobulin-like domain-containing protein [Candidatus Paceibacterota bacterium]
MNKTGWILSVVGLLIIIAAITLFVLPASTQAPTITNQHATTTPAEDLRPQIAGRIVVDTLKVGDTVASPITITGTAKGWYFEASFPVEVRNASGTILAQGPAQAQSDWMVDAFVPFTITLSFSAQPASSTGTVVFHKDNPSGLPENDESLTIPVVF